VMEQEVESTSMEVEEEDPLDAFMRQLEKSNDVMQTGAILLSFFFPHCTYPF
jgi:hypothetical protein